MDTNTIILIIIFILLIAGIPFWFFLVGYKLTQFNKECEKAKIRALDTFDKNKGKIAKQIDNQIKELGGKKQMQIDEFEFRDKNGNEVEPSKSQLIIYIKYLHKKIKDLKENQKQVTLNEFIEANGYTRELWDETVGELCANGVGKGCYQDYYLLQLVISWLCNYNSQL